MVYSGRMGAVYDEGFDEGHRQGLKDGKEAAKDQMLEWLQQEYLKPSVTRGSAPGIAILELARRMSQEFSVR